MPYTSNSHYYGNPAGIWLRPSERHERQVRFPIGSVGVLAELGWVIAKPGHLWSGVWQNSGMVFEVSNSWAKVATVCIALAAIFFTYWLLSTSAAGQKLISGEGLEATIEAIGLWGPVLVVGLITVAVVLSPIPSAPIALAAGAAYGHFWGTAYVLVGAETGALIAFGLARFLGYDLVRTWFGARLDAGLLGSQKVLMATVFLSRLMPFISFDIVSYAAGLTTLALWRFALATLAGIIPASFLLAHFGGELASADIRRVMIAVLALGAVTGLPLLVKALRAKLKNSKTRQPPAGDR